MIEAIFRAGARWEDGSKEDIAVIRGHLRKASERVFIDAMKLLAKDDHCSPEILHELARTPAMRRRMKEVGFIPPDPDDPNRHRWHRNRPTRFQEVLKKCGIELKKPKRPLPRTVRIGSPRSDGRKIRMDGRELFERVWTDPVATVAEEWGLSGRGLAKACRRVKVPVPPPRLLAEGQGWEAGPAAEAARPARRPSRGGRRLGIGVTDRLMNEPGVRHGVPGVSPRGSAFPVPTSIFAMRTVRGHWAGSFSGSRTRKSCPPERP